MKNDLEAFPKLRLLRCLRHFDIHLAVLNSVSSPLGALYPEFWVSLLSLRLFRETRIDSLT